MDLKLVFLLHLCYQIHIATSNDEDSYEQDIVYSDSRSEEHSYVNKNQDDGLGDSNDACNNCACNMCANDPPPCCKKVCDSCPKQQERESNIVMMPPISLAMPNMPPPMPMPPMPMPPMPMPPMPMPPMQMPPMPMPPMQMHPMPMPPIPLPPMSMPLMRIPPMPPMPQMRMPQMPMPHMQMPQMPMPPMPQMQMPPMQMPQMQFPMPMMPMPMPAMALPPMSMPYPDPRVMVFQFPPNIINPIKNPNMTFPPQNPPYNPVNPPIKPVNPPSKQTKPPCHHSPTLLKAEISEPTTEATTTTIATEQTTTTTALTTTTTQTPTTSQEQIDDYRLFSDQYLKSQKDDSNMLDSVLKNAMDEFSNIIIKTPNRDYRRNNVVKSYMRTKPKLPKFGIVPIPDKMAHKLMVQLRSMKEIGRRP